MPGRRWSRRAAPGRRGQGERRRSSSENQTLATDHLPELLPPLQEARRHDRHGRHRGRGVPRDLQARRRVRSRPTGRWSATTSARPRLQDRAREVRRGRRRDQRAAREGPAGPGRHALDREVGEARADAQAEGHRRTRSSTPSTTRWRPRSSRRPAARAPSPIATNMAGRGTDIFSAATRQDLGRVTRSGRSSKARRPRSVHRHRAPRVAPHRQPAPRPLRPPGRPRLVAASTSRSTTS